MPESEKDNTRRLCQVPDPEFLRREEQQLLRFSGEGPRQMKLKIGKHNVVSGRKISWSSFSAIAD